MMISKVLWPGKNHSVSVLSGGSTDSAIAEKEIVYLLYIDFDFMPINPLSSPKSDQHQISPCNI